MGEQPIPAAGYLESLTSRLARGLSAQSREFLDRHSNFLRRVQNQDGGWSGREGGSDLYYTAFALRGLAVAGGLTPSATVLATKFLRDQLTEAVSVVDFMSLLYAARLVQTSGGPDLLSDHGQDWPDRVAATLESFRKPDGGYGKATEGTTGSTYHTFLVALCYELIGRPMPGTARAVEFVQLRRRDDGGFVEVAPARRGGTNPTAAAVALLEMHHALDTAVQSSAIEFLAQMQSADGGLRANDRAPMSDLLSTFTGLLTLATLRAIDRIDGQSLHSFVQSIECPTGGFHGGLWDQATDVEYTFYGLGTTALMSSPR